MAKVVWWGGRISIFRQSDSQKLKFSQSWVFQYLHFLRRLKFITPAGTLNYCKLDIFRSWLLNYLPVYFLKLSFQRDTAAISYVCFNFCYKVSQRPQLTYKHTIKGGSSGLMAQTYSHSYATRLKFFKKFWLSNWILSFCRSRRLIMFWSFRCLILRILNLI